MVKIDEFADTKLDFVLAVTVGRQTDVVKICLDKCANIKFVLTATTSTLCENLN